MVIPGEVGTYDALVITPVVFPDAAPLAEDTVFEVAVDNVKAVVTAEKPMFIGATTEKFDGAQSPIASVLPAATKKVILHYNKAMSEASFNNITVEAVEGEDPAFTVYGDGNDVVIDLTNCLEPKTAYTIHIDGAFSCQNGIPLGSDTTFNFTTDDGEIAYLTPVILVNGNEVDRASAIAAGSTVTAEAEIVNTTVDDVDAYIVIASYKDDMLAGLEYAAYNPVLGLYNEKATVSFTADADFVGADELRAWLISDITDIKPLAEAIVLPGGNHAEATFSSAEPETAFMTAFLPTGISPKVVKGLGR